MTQSERIVAEALELSEEERAEVALRILESLEAPDPHAHLTDDRLEVELRRRVEDIESGQTETIPLDVARARVFGSRKA